MGKTIPQLTIATSTVVNDSNSVIAINGIGLTANKMTMGQAKGVFGTKKLTFTATGGETVITLSELENKYIVSIYREASILYEITTGSPDTTQYLWDETNIAVAPAMNPGERLLIQYRNL